jgi:hypothetical protein
MRERGSPHPADADHERVVARASLHRDGGFERRRGGGGRESFSSRGIVGGSLARARATCGGGGGRAADSSRKRMSGTVTFDREVAELFDGGWRDGSDL